MNIEIKTTVSNLAINKISFRWLAIDRNITFFKVYHLAYSSPTPTSSYQLYSDWIDFDYPVNGYQYFYSFSGFDVISSNSNEVKINILPI
jgi:hypothetical protein